MIRAACLTLASIIAVTPVAASPQPHKDWGRVGVPTAQLPPQGLCRVWRSGLPDGRQARPVACDLAHTIATKDSGASVLHDDGRLRRSYRFGEPTDRGDRETRCHLDDPRAACVIDAISRSSELIVSEP